MDKAKAALGYNQITNLTAAVGVGTIPAGAETVLLCVTGQTVRYRDDGTDPTTAVGMPLAVGVFYEFTIAQIARMRFIESAATAALNLSFYGTKT